MIRRIPTPSSAAQPAPVSAAPPDDANALLTPAQAAARLGVKAGVLERWRAIGEGPRFVRLSRKSIRYTAAEITSFIEVRIVSSTAAAIG